VLTEYRTDDARPQEREVYLEYEARLSMRCICINGASKSLVIDANVAILVY
jgi:hypothetical protein